MFNLSKALQSIKTEALKKASALLEQEKIKKQKTTAQNNGLPMPDYWVTVKRGGHKLPIPMEGVYPHGRSLPTRPLPPKKPRQKSFKESVLTKVVKALGG